MGLRRMLGKGGGEFNPINIANLGLWLDSLDSDTITEIGGVVDEWDDKSNTAPMYVDGIASRRPSYIDDERVNFNGSSNYMVRNNFVGSNFELLYDNLSSANYFVIFRTTTTAVTQMIYTLLYDLPAAYIPIFYVAGGNVFFATRNSVGGLVSVSTSLSANTYYLLSGSWDGDNLNFRINGVDVGSTSGANMTPTTARYDSIARRADGTPNFLSGDILSALAYPNTTLTSDEIESVENYLNTRFSIY